MNSGRQHNILLVGNDSTLIYLLGRFAEYSGYHLAVTSENLSVREITAINPTAIIFISTELLEKTQPVVGELSSIEAPILVCSSVADEAKARDLGADYCLLHPITYDDFQTALVKTNLLKRA